MVLRNAGRLIFIGLVPAKRAASTEPMVALRAE
jgi:hypothetical protein